MKFQYRPWMLANTLFFAALAYGLGLQMSWDQAYELVLFGNGNDTKTGNKVYY